MISDRNDDDHVDRPDPLESVYPNDIIDRIDRVLGEPHAAAAGSSVSGPSAAQSALMSSAPESARPVPGRSLRGHAAGVALATAAVTGVRDAIDDDVADRAIESFDPTWGVAGGPDQPVTLFFVPNDPWSTRAIVRPWLFPAVSPETSGATQTDVMA